VAEKSGETRQGHLFADLERTLRESDKSKRVEFYTHEEGWKNKLICGDSLHVMESLLHYEGMRGKVQMIYIDPPYGIKYDSNFQQRVDSTKNDEKERADDVLTIKAFRDTWTLGVHSYLSYLEERLYMSRELLRDEGSIFVQIGDDNAHLVSALLDEVFGKTNGVARIIFLKSSGRGATYLDEVYDVLLWYARDIERLNYTQLYLPYQAEKQQQLYKYVELPDGTEVELSDAQMDGQEPVPLGRRFKLDPLNSSGETDTGSFEYEFRGNLFRPPKGRHWSLKREGLDGLAGANRLFAIGKQLRFKRYEADLPFRAVSNVWEDAQKGTFVPENDYVVQTASKVIERCILMTTRPGDLVFDPTCGSGTSAYAAEKWGRRWITCDTSRVSANIARKRFLSSRFDHYETVNGAVKSGFRYETFDHRTPGSIGYGLEPEKVELVHRPAVDSQAIRVCGPFEVMSLGRYSVEDWKGYVVRESSADFGEAAKLENYIEVICRLYRKDAAIQGASGLVHAVVETEKLKIAISVGPLSGRVTAKQIDDAVKDALASGILETHVLGWAFEANVGEVKSQLEGRGKVKIELIMIRPDTLAEGLKATQPEMLFSPLALPDIEVKLKKDGKGPVHALVTLNGVALFDRKHRRTEYKHADSGYVSAWYLDEDYDGDCFVDCQMFFDFKKAPNLKAALKTGVDPEEYKLQLASQPFPVRGYKRIAVKVVDVYGNESTVVHELK
jgi:adenine-specific DNA-methyltransferase